MSSLLREYGAHYHGERNHRGLGNNLIEPSNATSALAGRVLRRKRIGGLLNFYYRTAA
jgi:hypothetical protein